MTISESEQPTALITGASGFAGGHLARQLTDAGYAVTGLSATGARSSDGMAMHAVDICDRRRLAELVADVRPASVFHLAAIVDTVETDSVVELHRVNVLGTASLVEAVKEQSPNSRIVFTSSAFVYGVTAPQEQPVGESQPLRPLTPYGASKVAAEAIISQYARSGGDALIARSFQHTGPGHVGAYALSDWAKQLAQIKLAGGSESMSTGNLDVERDYLDVRDVTSAYRHLAESPEASGVYNVSRGEGVTMRQLLEGMIAAFDVDVEIKVDAARLRSVDQPRVVGDSARLRGDTGWTSSIPLDQTLSDLAAYWLDQIASGVDQPA